MYLTKKKFNLLLVSTTAFIILILVTIDSDSLDSLVVSYKDDFVINEVNIGSSNDNKEKENDTNKSGIVTFVSKLFDNNKWSFPVSGNYVITTYYNNSHKAIDIYGYGGYGSNILSANSGTVITAVSGCVAGNISCNGRRGNYVVIKHNLDNYYTVYMHLASIKVKVGDKVNSGSVIATMGNTGQVVPVPTSNNPYGGTHLHFCVFKGEPYNGGYAINPLNLY